MKISNKFKNWLFYNLKRFHSEDLYLKYLSSEILISNFKHKLDSAYSYDDLLLALETSEFTSKFEFYRKGGNYFSYPSFKEQVESLVDCWDEIQSFYINTKFSEEDDTTEDEEAFSNATTNNLINIQRGSFGNKPNLSSTPGSLENKTVRDQIISGNKYVMRSFKSEYNLFKKRCLQELNSSECAKGNSYFIQTDIKEFFHKIDLECALDVLDSYGFIILKSWLKKIRENQEKQIGLPIGWILSGIVADILIQDFRYKIADQSVEICKVLKVKKFEMINYVDDMVVFFHQDQPVSDLRFLDRFIGLVQGICHDTFGATVNFYGSNSHKAKELHLTKKVINHLQTNWHEVDFFVSGLGETMTKKWSALDEFLLPHDNELILNEKAQFYQNLQNIKMQVENGDLSEEEEINQYIDKILFKLDGDKKYIVTITDVVLLMTEKRGLQQKKKVIDRLWRVLTTSEDLNVVTILQFLSSLSKESRINHDYSLLFETLVREAISLAGSRFSVSSEGALLRAFAYQNHVTSIGASSDSLLYFETASLRVKEATDSLQGIDTENPREMHSPQYVAASLLWIFKDRKLASADALQLILRAINIVKPLLQNKKLTADYLLCRTSFLFVPDLDGGQLKYLSEFLKDRKMSGPSVKEIISLASNHDHFMRAFNHSSADGFHHYVESVKSKDGVSDVLFDFEIFRKRTRKESGFLKVLEGMICASSCYRDAIKIVFFQYVPVESFVYFSWKCLPEKFGPKSLDALLIVRNILSITTSSEEEDVTRRIVVDPGLGEVASKLENVHKIDLDLFDSFFNKEGTFTSPELKLMVSSLAINVKKDLDKNDIYRLSDNARKRIHREVMSSLRQARKLRCKVVVFPELTLPEDKLTKYFDYCGANGITLIGGVEYLLLGGGVVGNCTVISLPVQRNASPTGKQYHAFSQFKKFLSIKEIDCFKPLICSGSVSSLFEGSDLSVFISSVVKAFAVLTCSDFLSLENKYFLQGKVQSVFVPAMNYDNTTYHHVAQAAVREMYAYCIVCNNSELGGSLVCSPFRKEFRRINFKVEGDFYPKSHVLRINPSVISELQALGRDKNLVFDESKMSLVSDAELTVGDFKQVPPDWFKIKPIPKA